MHREVSSSLLLWYSIMFFPLVALIDMLHVLASGDRYFLHFHIGWGGSSVVGCTASFPMAVHINQESVVLADIFAPTPGPTGLPDIQVFGFDDSIQL
jgi:hypothetical protein